MNEEMPDIDVSGIEALRDLNKEREVYQDRLDKLEEMKGKVTETVYAKVKEDYREKLLQLTTDAEPLKMSVRNQYAILHGILQKLEATMTEFSMQKEELELRNMLGEYEGDSFNVAMREWEESHLKQQAELDSANELKELFLSAFSSEEELLEAPSLETVPIENETELESESISDELVVAESDAEELSEADVDELHDDLDELDEFGTELDSSAELDDITDDLSVDMSDSDLSADFDELGDDLTTVDDFDDDDEDTEDNLMPITDDPLLDTQPLNIGGIPPALPGEEATMRANLGNDMVSSNDPDGTMIISNPKIIALNHAIEGQVVSLGMVTTSMGRSPENDLHITEDRISRKHSQISFGAGGYSIYDLNSENGTYVNGNRIREHFLSDGDIIMIGTYKFLYRDH